MVQKHNLSLVGRFAIALNLEFDANIGFNNTAKIYGIIQFGYQSHTTVHQYRLIKLKLFNTVVHLKFKIFHLYNLIPQIW
jgi:hypothetical protein